MESSGEPSNYIYQVKNFCYKPHCPTHGEVVFKLYIFGGRAGSDSKVIGDIYTGKFTNLLNIQHDIPHKLGFIYRQIVTYEKSYIYLWYSVVHLVPKSYKLHMTNNRIGWL